MDIIGIMGYYDLVSMTLITMQAGAPNDSVPPLPVYWRNKVSNDRGARAKALCPPSSRVSGDSRYSGGIAGRLCCGGRLARLARASLAIGVAGLSSSRKIGLEK